MGTTYDIATKQSEPGQDSRAPAVVVEQLRKSYGRLKVLDGISLSVNPGATLAVLGRSGTGKSVLLRLIIGWKHRTRARFAFMARILSD